MDELQEKYDLAMHRIGVLRKVISGTDKIYSDDYNLLFFQTLKLQGALGDIYKFWENMDVPKPYFIGNKCEEALGEYAEFVKGAGK